MLVLGAILLALAMIMFAILAFSGNQLKASEKMNEVGDQSKNGKEEKIEE